MAGTLTISTLSDGTNSTSSTNCIQGSAKAWVNFAGASGTRNASYNVSSVTRNSTGNYTVNFTNALTDANFSTVGTYAGANTNGVSSVDIISQASSNVNFITTTYGASTDPTFVCAACFR